MAADHHAAQFSGKRTHTRGKQAVLVNPNSPSATIVPGTAGGPGAPAWFVDMTLATDPTIPASPVCWNTHHYYYAQWFFFCGSGAPFNLADSFFVSDLFRIPVSNPH